MKVSLCMLMLFVVVSMCYSQKTDSAYDPCDTLLYKFLNIDLADDYVCRMLFSCLKTEPLQEYINSFHHTQTLRVIDLTKKFKVGECFCSTLGISNELPLDIHTRRYIDLVVLELIEGKEVKTFRFIINQPFIHNQNIYPNLLEVKLEYNKNTNNAKVLHRKSIQ